MYQQLTWCRRNIADLQKGHLPMTCKKCALSSQVPSWPCCSKNWRSLTNGKIPLFFFSAQSKFSEGNTESPVGKQVNRNTSKVKQTCRKYCTWLLYWNVRPGSEEEPCNVYWLKSSWSLTEPEKECGKAGSSPCSSTKYLYSPGQIPSLLCAVVVHLRVESKIHLKPLHTRG